MKMFLQCSIISISTCFFFQILRLSSDFDQLNHIYEYVKRLVSLAIRNYYSLPDPGIVVKPNKVSYGICSLNGGKLMAPCFKRDFFV